MRYRAVSRPYARRFGYKYRRHVFDKLRALHVVIVVDSAREEETLVTVYEPDPSIWTADFRRSR